MADGTYERRGPREAELKRLQRLIDERRLAKESRPDGRLAGGADERGVGARAPARAGGKSRVLPVE